MKKLITIFTAILVNLAVISQTDLTKISFVNEEVVNVSAVQSNSNFTFTTSNTFYKYLNTSLTVVNTNTPGYNDIDGLSSATGDTLSVKNDHYGYNTNIIYNGSNVTGSNISLNTLNVNDIAKDNTDNIYTLGKSGSNYFVYQINNGAIMKTLDFGSTPSSSLQFIESYETITYFEYSGSQYLLITGNFNSGYKYTVFDITGLSNGGAITNFYQGGTDIQNASYSNNNGLYFNINGDNDIYEFTGTFNSGTFTGNPVYSSLSTINDLSINDQIGSAFRIYVATIDGIYTNEVSLSVEDKELNFENVTLYPNPNNGNFTIDNLEFETNINIINTSGQIVHSEIVNNTTSISLDMSLPTGIYFVQLSNGNYNKTIKFLKQ